VQKSTKLPGRQLAGLSFEQLDVADQARAQVSREGLTTKSERSGVVRAHPLVSVEAAARKMFARCRLSLGLDWSADIDPSKA
jgi:phage terminase small subunit